MFSPLQRFILSASYTQRGKEVKRNTFLPFYINSKIGKYLPVKIITKSLERLIDRGMLVGYGVRTPKKWFIRAVKITRLGIKSWEVWLASRQSKLPLK